MSQFRVFHICIILAVTVILCWCTSTVTSFHMMMPQQQQVSSSIHTASKLKYKFQPISLSYDDSDMNDNIVQTTSTISTTPSTLISSIVMGMIVATMNIPFISIVHAVVQDDNYEYGAVDAPIGIAVGGGLLAILTALLPIALRGGEEAFEEIKDRDSTTFGKGNNSNVLKSKKK